MNHFTKVVKTVLGIFLGTMILCMGVLTLKGYKDYRDALAEKPLEQSLEEVFQKEDFISLSEISPIYKDELIAVEDHRFYNHPGVDVIAIGRAVVNDLRAGALVEGGSTITQQLAKNIYFSQEKSFSRKIAEVFMAMKIESEYSKEEILDLYVNSIYYGDGYYTLKSACEGYFGKEPEAMNDYECTLLVGVPNAPSVYAPTASMELAEKRQNQVLEAMLRQGMIDEEDKQMILAQEAAGDSGFFIVFRFSGLFPSYLCVRA